MRFSEIQTQGGYKCGEVASALQKSIRRGLERDAMFWASELDQAGYGNYVWKRLRIIASEDVGLADPQVVLLTRALWDNWQDSKKAKDDPANSALFLCHAVVVLCRAKKSRLVDHALMVGWEAERPALEIPDYALDQHTSRGRQMGRGQDHFFDVGTQLENEGEVADPYAAEGRASRTRPRASATREQETLPVS
jgi:replication-associated recombination protein RarA